MTRAGWWQVALGDVGHPRAKNAPDTWHFLNQQAWQFLQSQIISITFARGGSTTSIDPDPNGPADDPLVNYIGGQIVPGQNQNCPASAGPARYTESQPLSRERTYIGLGSVTVPNILAGTTAPFDARVWDVPPGPSQNQAGSPACRATPTPQGCPLLITRGTYRLDVPRTRTPQG